MTKNSSNLLFFGKTLWPKPRGVKETSGLRLRAERRRAGMSFALGRALGVSSSALSTLMGSLRSMGARAKNGKPTNKSMVRTRNGPTWPKGRQRDIDARWWQPLLPAMAAKVATALPGWGKSESGGKGRIRSLRRTHQIIWDHAKRIEGSLRNKLFASRKKIKERERTDAVLREYAEVLRSKAKLSVASAAPTLPL